MRITVLYDVKLGEDLLYKDIKMTELEDITGSEATTITGRFRDVGSDTVMFGGYWITRKHYDTYFHKNGYKARLYGESSMIVYDKRWKEVKRTDSRSCNTEEVMELLGNMPKMLL